MTFYDIEIEELQDDIEKLRKQQDRVETDKQYDDLEDKIQELLDEINNLKASKEQAIWNNGIYSDDDIGL